MLFGVDARWSAGERGQVQPRRGPCQDLDRLSCIQTRVCRSSIFLKLEVYAFNQLDESITIHVAEVIAFMLLISITPHRHQTTYLDCG
jgi:hypothetical protein